MASTLYILYNADASVMGKLTYGYRKLTAPKHEPACAACDITHGGLHLDETVEWKQAKERIGHGSRVDVKQLHRDEMGADVKHFVERLKLQYPMVLSRNGEGDFELVMDRVELADCSGNAQNFVQKLAEKGIFGKDASTTAAASSLL